MQGGILALSARNKLKGKIVFIEKDKLSTIIKLRVEGPSVITAFITREAAEEMGLKEGDEAAVVIKSTEVMVSKE